jgi:hypothetical protein
MKTDTDSKVGSGDLLGGVRNITQILETSRLIAFSGAKPAGYITF